MHVLQDTTVRKLYITVRKDLKVNWDFKDAFQLYYANSSPLLKTNKKICNPSTDLYNGITLYVKAQTGSYNWDLFIEVQGGHRHTVTIGEVR